ncbi:MAG: hypothetical protein ABI877_22755 [Gemmatimonadaceae bacterium]
MPTKLSAELIKRSQEAPFVFQGRVRAVGENNLQGIPPTTKHALVDVEQVVLAPSNLGELRGRVLTVVLAKPAKKGSRGMWWATSWVFGDEIGVIEVARSEGVASVSTAADVVNARLAALDDLVIDRVMGADLIVAGTVVSVEELGVDGIAEGTTWRLALVRVASVVKGNAGAEVVVQFPGIGSPRWATAPRLVLEQQGVFILRRPSREPRMRKVKASGTWVALDPNDVHAPSSLARIEALARIPETRTGRAARTR